MAIVADDPALTERFLERHRSLDSPDSSDLVYGGRYVALAAFFESDLALSVLLDGGMSAAEVVAGIDDTPIIDAQVFSESGLWVIRRLVDAGADIESRHSNGPTAIEVAAWHGDLLKVQCLYALGAALPPPTRADKASILRSRKDIEKTNSFIESETKEMPLLVSEICSTGED